MLYEAHLETCGFGTWWCALVGMRRVEVACTCYQENNYRVISYNSSFVYNYVDTARRFFQSRSEEESLKEKGKYQHKVDQQRRRNRVLRVSWYRLP